MAKKDEVKTENNENESAGSKVLTFIIILLIVFIWLAILALLIKFDVGGIGSNTFRPLLKDVPVLNRILPDVSDEQLAYENQYPYKSLSEAIEALKELELKTDKLIEENDDYAARQAEMQTEMNSLQHYADEYEEFLKQREAFDREIVYNDKAPDTDEYLKWYATIYPENAAKIYEELKELEKVDDVYKEIAAYFNKIKPVDAAAILMEYTSDVDFAVNILKCLKTATVSKILTEVEKKDSLFAARIVNRMKDMAFEDLED